MPDSTAQHAARYFFGSFLAVVAPSHSKVKDHLRPSLCRSMWSHMLTAPLLRRAAPNITQVSFLCAGITVLIKSVFTVMS
jgi:hypothetical protein